MYATRNVRSFERGPLQVRANDWVLVSVGDGSSVGRVGEIVELVASGGSFMRLHLHEMRPISESFDPMRRPVSLCEDVCRARRAACDCGEYVIPRGVL